jgi:hypothetical protein
MGTNPQHCGACGKSCAGYQKCEMGMCSPVYMGTNRLGLGMGARGLVVTPDGAAVVVGVFTGTVDFDPGAGEASLTARGASDIFVTKFNRDGSYAWTRAVGGAMAANVAIGDIDIAADGSSGIVGTFQGVIEVWPHPTDARLTARGMTDVFMLKFTPDGQVAFLRARASAQGTGCHAFVVEMASEGSMFVGGDCNDPPPGTLAGSDGYVMKLAANGDAVYSRSFVSVESLVSTRLIRHHQDGSVVVAGHFEGKFDLDPRGTSDVRGAPAPGRAFLVRLDAAGAYLAGTTLDWGIWGNGLAHLTHMAIADNKDVYIAGRVDAAKLTAVDLDPTGGHDMRNTVGKLDVVLVKLGADGAYRWGQLYGGAEDERANRVSATPDGGVLVAGDFRSATLPLDPPAGQPRSAQEHGSFLLKVNANRGYEWSVIGGGPGSWTNDLAVDARGFSWGGTYFRGTDFDPGPGVDMAPTPPVGMGFVSRFVY